MSSQKRVRAIVKLSSAANAAARALSTLAEGGDDDFFEEYLCSVVEKYGPGVLFKPSMCAHDCVSVLPLMWADNITKAKLLVKAGAHVNEYVTLCRWGEVDGIKAFLRSYLNPRDWRPWRHGEQPFFIRQVILTLLVLANAKPGGRLNRIRYEMSFLYLLPEELRQYIYEFAAHALVEVNGYWC